MASCECAPASAVPSTKGISLSTPPMPTGPSSKAPGPVSASPAARLLRRQMHPAASGSGGVREVCPAPSGHWAWSVESPGIAGLQLCRQQGLYANQDLAWPWSEVAKDECSQPLPASKQSIGTNQCMYKICACLTEDGQVLRPEGYAWFIKRRPCLLRSRRPASLVCQLSHFGLHALPTSALRFLATASWLSWRTCSLSACRVCSLF